MLVVKIPLAESCMEKRKVYPLMQICLPWRPLRHV